MYRFSKKLFPVYNVYFVQYMGLCMKVPLLKSVKSVSAQVFQVQTAAHNCSK